MTPTCADCGSGPRHSRGLCTACYKRHEYHRTLADYPRVYWPAGELLDEWERLRDDGTSVRDAAVRLGMTYDALLQAMCRARARGDARGRRAPFGRAATASNHTYTVNQRQQA